jgi:hypothetical protein
VLDNLEGRAYHKVLYGKNSKCRTASRKLLMRAEAVSMLEAFAS